MIYLGDFKALSTIYTSWNTFDSLGASVTRTVNGTIYVYQDDVTGTETTTGVTDTEDFDGVTGVHWIKVVTTDAFYAAGHDYIIVLKAATIDGQVINSALAQFSIENRNDYADVVELNGYTVTAGDTLNANVIEWGGCEVQAGSDCLPEVAAVNVVNSNLVSVTGESVALIAGALDANLVAINGGSVAATNNVNANITEVAGVTVDTDTAQLGVNVVEWAGCDAQTGSDCLPEVAAINTVDANIIEINGNPAVVSSTALDTNVVQISGDSVAADNLETALDGGAYNVGGGAVVAASVTGSVGSVAVGGIAANSFVAGAVNAAAIADGAIDAATFAAGAIDATAIATGAIDADALSADAIVEIVEGLLKYDFNLVAGESTRSVLNALRKLMNKITLSAGTLRVYREDDATVAWTQSTTTSTTASQSVIGLDTN